MKVLWSKILLRTLYLHSTPVRAAYTDVLNSSFSSVATRLVWAVGIQGGSAYDCSP